MDESSDMQQAALGPGRQANEPDAERADIPAFTSWPLGVTAFKLFVFSQPPVSRDKGLTMLEKRLDGSASPSVTRK